MIKQLCLLIFCLSTLSCNDFLINYKVFTKKHSQKINIKKTVNKDLIRELEKTCKKIGVSETIFLKWLYNLPDFQYDEKVLRRYLEPKRKNISKSSNKKNAHSVLKQKNINRIKLFIVKNSIILTELEAKYHVPKEVITSIYSHETRLGVFKLPHIALNILLSELLYIDEVSKFNKNLSLKRIKRLKRLARYSLINLYKYWIPSKTLYSSWAGACGPMQFMPFNFHYLKDGNGDGIIDPSNQFDSLAGAFNFIKLKGWSKALTKDFQRGEISNKMHKVILKYNSSDEYASGILNTALKLK
ncbi:MAG: hypothetical protein COB02_10745 [Candidatus Cloacimonadota bacterium]|nr:MAG: hypothetical protein COB02_10745 [Candidatus Cloacimonadota bacterium]